MPNLCASERRELAERMAGGTVQDMRAMSWADRHEYYYFMVQCAQDDAACGHILGELGIRRPAEFVAFLLSYVRDMMGADELIEGQNLARRANLPDVPIPLANVGPSWVGPPPWAGGRSHVAPGQHQTTLVDAWGATSIRRVRSSWKGVKKQTKITHWLHTGTATGRDTKTDDTATSKKRHVVL